LKGDAFRGLDLLLGVVAPTLNRAIAFACAIVGVPDGEFNEAFLCICICIRIRIGHDTGVVGVFGRRTARESYRNRQPKQDQQRFHGNRFLCALVLPRMRFRTDCFGVSSPITPQSIYRLRLKNR
jgi:hypothetical protein